MVQHSKKTFRDGSYYAYAMVGKRTVKEGECAAVWDAGGRRHVIAGPRRVRLFFSHVRFLDRHVADTNQYLRVQYRDGRKEHRRGPYALFFDPCVHQSVAVDDAYQLSANEAVVVYREKGAAATVALGEAPSTPLAARTKSNGVLLPAVGVKMAAVGEKGALTRTRPHSILRAISPTRSRGTFLAARHRRPSHRLGPGDLHPRRVRVGPHILVAWLRLPRQGLQDGPPRRREGAYAPF